MATDLERYGVFALIFVVLLIVGISIWGPQREDEPLLAAGESALYVPAENAGAAGEQLVSSTLLGDPEADARTEHLSAFYKVQAGDNPTKIVRKLYGSDNYVDAFLKANPGLRPERLQENDLLRLPAVDKAPNPRYIIAEAELAPLALASDENLRRDVVRDPTPTAVKPVAVPTPVNDGTNAQRYHIVRDGERLEKIAKRYYGDKAFITKIQAANPKVKNPDFIRAGMKLILP